MPSPDERGRFFVVPSLSFQVQADIQFDRQTGYVHNQKAFPRIKAILEDIRAARAVVGRTHTNWPIYMAAPVRAHETAQLSMRCDPGWGMDDDAVLDLSPPVLTVDGFVKEVKLHYNVDSSLQVLAPSYQRARKCNEAI